MERKEFEKCCRAIEEGEEIYLENLADHEKGRALFCSGGQFQVRVSEESRTWSPESCEEVSSSSESPHSNL